MEISNRKSVMDNLKLYDCLVNDDKCIEVTEWANGEGWDISIGDNLISLSRGSLEAIIYLTMTLDYKNNNK